METPPNHLITGVTLVDSLTSVPPDYTVISQTVNGSGTADLARLKKSCYLCYRREKLGTCPTTTPALVDLVLLHDGSPIPAGYTLVVMSGAQPSSRRRSKKAKFYVKYSPLNSAKDLVTDIAISSRGHHVAGGFAFIGEIHSLWIFIRKMPHSPASTPVHHLPDRPSAEHRPTTDSLRLTQQPRVPSSLPEPKPRPVIYSAEYVLSGVPFELNKKYFMDSIGDFDGFLEQICCKTPEEVEKEFNYGFALERSVIRSP
ncbi:ESCRT-I complex subunit MVB12 [Clonorchis sinensis]|uniref:Multivesicular body subunit 12A n=1 Tax=Clonorchis sinensis TaxID=79923 RepID=H2KR27_CLOSI|nr:ESCRT-I complex subunit MVB12 [Clonorchis sinensis]